MVLKKVILLCSLLIFQQSVFALHVKATQRAAQGCWKIALPIFLAHTLIQTQKDSFQTSLYGMDRNCLIDKIPCEIRQILRLDPSPKAQRSFHETFDEIEEDYRHSPQSNLFGKIFFDAIDLARKYPEFFPIIKERWMNQQDPTLKKFYFLIAAFTHNGDTDITIQTFKDAIAFHKKALAQTPPLSIPFCLEPNPEEQRLIKTLDQIKKDLQSGLRKSCSYITVQNLMPLLDGCPSLHGIIKERWDQEEDSEIKEIYEQILLAKNITDHVIQLDVSKKSLKKMDPTFDPESSTY